MDKKAIRFQILVLCRSIEQEADQFLGGFLHHFDFCGALVCFDLTNMLDAKAAIGYNAINMLFLMQQKRKLPLFSKRELEEVQGNTSPKKGIG